MSDREIATEVENVIGLLLQANAKLEQIRKEILSKEFKTADETPVHVYLTPEGETKTYQVMRDEDMDRFNQTAEIIQEEEPEPRTDDLPTTNTPTIAELRAIKFPEGEKDKTMPVEFNAKVVNMPEVVEWKSENTGKKGLVCVPIVEDVTGEIAVCLWNEQTQLIPYVSKGDIVAVKGWKIEDYKYKDKRGKWRTRRQVLLGKYGHFKLVGQETLE